MKRGRKKDRKSMYASRYRSMMNENKEREKSRRSKGRKHIQNVRKEKKNIEN